MRRRLIVWEHPHSESIDHGYSNAGFGWQSPQPLIEPAWPCSAIGVSLSRVSDVETGQMA